MAKQAISNPFVLDGQPLDTIHFARCAILFIRETTEALHNQDISENAAFGFHLILKGVTDALLEAEEQVSKAIKDAKK